MSEEGERGFKMTIMGREGIQNQMEVTAKSMISHEGNKAKC